MEKLEQEKENKIIKEKIEKIEISMYTAIYRLPSQSQSHITTDGQSVSHYVKVPRLAILLS
jgi:hypothetical protein